MSCLIWIYIVYIGICFGLPGWKDYEEHKSQNVKTDHMWLQALKFWGLWSHITEIEIFTFSYRFVFQKQF